jgi:hypothetical protein
VTHFFDGRDGSSDTDTPVYARVTSALPVAIAPSLFEIKWDTVPLNFPRNWLKTKETDPHKVGHFFESRLDTRALETSS